ncbi:hypothetical protein F0562_025528 [Nyssa sinensis]|uniref:Reverse transcriptase Ty1/copia-type domain-containing protein n=1 Tax=Nyssa sinensis TaxID=561372 RepID=A0A5J5B907_9ASTE|nr:hypothetical protein F0562_025528 [Nyssa sinensis]
MKVSFEMSMIGEKNFFLVLQVKMMRDGILISQSKYAKELVKKFDIENAKHTKTPMSTSTKLSSDTIDKDVDPTLYKSMIGNLLYLSFSRPDIAFSVGVCARFQSKPKESHSIALKRVVRYINATLEYGIRYSIDTNATLAAYSYADLASNVDDRKSTNDHCSVSRLHLHQLVSTFIVVSTVYGELSFILLIIMAPCRHLVTEDQFPFAISLVPQPRNPPLYRSATARTRRPFIQGREFLPERDSWHSSRGSAWFSLCSKHCREKVLARALHCDRSKAFQVIGAHLSQGLLSEDYRFLNLVVSYDLSPMSHTNNLTRSHSTLLYATATGVPIGGAYVNFSAIDSAASGRHTVVLPFGSVITRICVGQGVPIYTSDMVRELSGPFIRRTLTQSQRHVGLVDADADAAEDMEADVAEASGTVLDEDYLALSTQRTHIQAIHERQDQFAANLSAMATDLHSLIPDDDDDDDDGDDGDDGDFP